jgi:putrescine transport system substrate-binding protein
MYRATEVGRPVELAYTTPREGALAWFDLWFIPADAPHPTNAHLFLNYLLRPEVIAAISNETRYAAPNLKAMPYVLPEVRDDPAVYPPEDVRRTIHQGRLHSPKEERVRSRLWSRVKTGL